jgi:4-amino-4-deoxy-L-arabinose transferase-like glycosyltransferase
MRTYKPAIYLAVLIAATLLVTTKDITKGEFRYTDASRHAMDGVYFRDVLHDLPVTNLYDYTIRYYAKYPALALLYYYPPFFALVEGVFFSVLGISTVTARLTVVSFALLAITAWFYLIKRMYDDRLAFFSGFLIITTPFVVLWSRQVMLEIPAMALVILSSYFFYNVIEVDNRRHAYFLGITLILAGLTKQHTLFLIPFFILYSFARKRQRYLFTKEMIIAVSAVTLILVPTYATIIKSQVLLFEKNVGAVGPLELTSMVSSSNLFYYPRKLPELVTWPVTVLALVSIALAIARRDKREVFFLFWLGSHVLMLVSLQIKDVRYAFLWIPPLVLFAVLSLSRLTWSIRKVRVSTVLLVLVSVFQLGWSYPLNTPSISGYEEGAKFVVQYPKGDTVLFDGWLDGHFIFYARKYDSEKRMIILRGRKMLYSSPFSEWDSRMAESYVEDTSDILGILDRYGTKYVIVESKDLVDIPARGLLRQVLRSDAFRLVRRIPIVSTVRKLDGVYLLIYEYKKDVHMTAETLVLPMLGIGRRFVVPTKSLKTLFDGSNP